ncbi:23S rRNA (uracil(1939)-C(5))-methyltransferase RlmD [Paenibacillus massiliensis]|uniref:23S rRNA (uracil(1939)-C(5))-methyltransferase RlmD n=1 Tax=Paenibacillus massiliensis TaxID=225917 RepID=UPI000400F3ED|nr:23S rRNA (uracil(1939)-C(5))-methyltransferase RlmD [Paenibacillus massiliensis]
MSNHRSGRGKSRRNANGSDKEAGRQRPAAERNRSGNERGSQQQDAGQKRQQSASQKGQVGYSAGDSTSTSMTLSTSKRTDKSKGKSKDQVRTRAPRPAKQRAAAEISGLPVEKNQEVVVDIIGMNHDGEGVGRAEGYTLFIPGALPGEQVRVKVLKTKKQYGYAKLLNVVQASPDRIASPCPIYDQCGGCQLQHMSYAGQLEWKRQHVVDVLERIGKLEIEGRERTSVGAQEKLSLSDSKAQDDQGAQNVLDTQDNQDNQGNQDSLNSSQAAKNRGAVVVHPTLGMQEPWRYRNKAQVPMGAADGGLIGGFYAKGSHRIVDMETCLIQHEHNDEVVAKVKEIGSHLGISAYNEETGRGLLRHVVVKKAFRTGEMMLVLVTNGHDIPHRDAWIGSIREAIPHVVSICQNVNTKRTNVIFGDETRVLWGRDVIYDYIGNVQFAISARSFYQVNPVQTEVLYGKTLEYAALTGKETVIDAYCGIGTISLFLAQHADQVYGVEIVREAIEDARSNAQLNELRNVRFEVGASEDVIPRWKEEGITADVIVVDPPRKGCDPRLLDTILEMKPERVVYVSCNPSTLARDLRILEDGGYRTVEVQPVDMFPHTVHVESVVLMLRNKR